MKKVLKKVLKEALDDRKLRAMTVWFNNYVDMLEEFVDENGNIYLYASNGDIEITIEEDYGLFYCWVYHNLWVKFCEEFSLKDIEVKSFIKKWGEDVYQIKFINTYYLGYTKSIGYIKSIDQKKM